MNRTKLEIISLKGTPVEITYQLGKLRKHIIAKRVEHWNQLVSKTYAKQKTKLKTLEALFLKEAIKQGPQYLEEVYALAEGSGIPFADVFRLNLTELIPFAEKCTTLAFSVKTKSGKSILLAHNEDWDPKRNDVFILKAELPNLSYLIVAYDGYLPGLSCGYNSNGIYHAINYLRPGDLRPGIPRIFITRHLVTTENISDCLKWIQSRKRAFGQSIHLANKDEYINLELTAKNMVIRKPQLPTAHTNHYIDENLRKQAPLASATTMLRLETAQSILAKAKTEFSLKQAQDLAKKILSDRSGYPYAIWREADNPYDSSATLVSVLMNTDSKVCEVYRKRPDQNQSHKLSF